MSWSTIEQMKAWWTPARKAARHREDAILQNSYPGRYVAYTDDWHGEELVRTVVAATPDPAEFQRLLAALAPEFRSRVRTEPIPAADPPPLIEPL